MTRTKMKKSIKKLWLKALRSGGYEQGKGQLRNDNKYCCLGVLADVQGFRWKRRQQHFLDGGDAMLLQPECLAGMDDKTQHFLASLNDRGWKFKTIANWIEKNL